MQFQRTQSKEPNHWISCLKENAINCIKIFIAQQTGNFYSEKVAITSNKGEGITDFP